MTLCLSDAERGRLAAERARTFEARYGQLGAEAALRLAIRDLFPGRIALVSSFGAESAVLLDMVARIDPATPVVFLDTGKHFGETLRYRNALAARLGLSDLRSAAPSPAALAEEDRDGLLFARDPDRCCALRKTLPLTEALAGFEAWITGRKAFQAATRAGLPLFESDGPRIKVNPLRHWRPAWIAEHFARHGLPPHPLEAEGFRSIGCYTCTARAAPQADARAGRWPGLAKTECGIHVGLGG
ncbi:MAG: phosphoadenylyl-sulfate reductase [Kiloniellales bacterium]|nr:phosphoadenylyl-sulfate reductase [Kiloniellales bacterium]